MLEYLKLLVPPELHRYKFCVIQHARAMLRLSQLGLHFLVAHEHDAKNFEKILAQDP